MSEFEEFDEFDRKVAELFRQEKRKEQVYYESIQPELAELQDAFYEHIAAIEGAHFDGELTVADILETEQSPIDHEELAGAVNELLQRDIEYRSEVLFGDVHIKGIGEFAYLHEDGEVADSNLTMYEALDDGESIVGALDANSIVAIPEVDGITLSLHVKGATLYDVAGNRQLFFEDGVIIPIDSPSMEFAKVIYGGRETLPADATESKRLDTRSLLKSSFLEDICNDIENNLNQNDYQSEERFTVRGEEQAQLNTIIEQMIQPDEHILLSADAAVFMDGSCGALVQQPASYVESDIVYFQGKWRVIHGFTIYVGEGSRLAYVLPEDIS